MSLYPARALERAMKIQEVILRAVSGKILWMQAAEILGISDRSMRRWKQRYEEHGYDGLFDRRQQRPSPKRVPMATVEKVLRLYREQYFDLNVKHFAEKLAKSMRSTQLHLDQDGAADGGLGGPKRKRGRHRKQRPRRPLPGMLLHVDGSRHAWLGPGQGQQDLIVVFDDANSEVYYAQLVPEESTLTVMAGLKTVIEQQGVFCSLYVDRGSHFVTTPVAGGAAGSRAEDPDWPSAGTTGHRTDCCLLAPGPGALRAAVWHLARAAGGRTALPSDHHPGSGQSLFGLPVAGHHNRNFKVAAQQSGTAFVPYRGTELDKIFSIQQERVVGNDNTVRFDNLTLQIESQTFRYSLARCRVLVCRHLDGTLSLYYGQHCVGRYDATGRAAGWQNRPQVGRLSGVAKTA